MYAIIPQQIPQGMRAEVNEKILFAIDSGKDLIPADCVIRWRDTLETVEARITLSMDSNTKMDDEIFYYCNGVDDLKSLADKSMEDFTIAECLGFGIYEELLQTT